MTDDGDVWWEGMTAEPPAHAIDWHGNDWTPERRRPRPPTPTRASRRPAAQDPAIARRVGGPGRRADRRLPVRRPPRDGRAARAPRRSTGSTASSWARRWPRRRRPRPPAQVGKLRFDPFAMLPFCGYNMADYFAHWLKIGAEGDGAKLPKIFYVNWFRKDEDGQVPVARLRRELARAGVGLPPLRRHGARRSRRRSASCRRRATWTSTGWSIDEAHLDAAADRRRRRAARRRCRRSRSTSRSSATGCRPRSASSSTRSSSASAASARP